MKETRSKAHLDLPRHVIAHEAAHAVIAHYVGVRVVEMSVVPSQTAWSEDPACAKHGCVTTTLHGGDIDRFLNQLFAGRASLNEVVGMMMIYLAGPVSEGNMRGGLSDRDKAVAIAMAFTDDDERSAKALVAMARSRVSGLVRKYRPAITKLSQALTVTPKLRGHELQRLLR